LVERVGPQVCLGSPGQNSGISNSLHACILPAPCTGQQYPRPAPQLLAPHGCQTSVYAIGAGLPLHPRAPAGAIVVRAAAKGGGWPSGAGEGRRGLSRERRAGGAVGGRGLEARVMVQRQGMVERERTTTPSAPTRSRKASPWSSSSRHCHCRITGKDRLRPRRSVQLPAIPSTQCQVITAN